MKWLVFLLFLLPLSTQAAISFDASSQGKTTGTTVTISHTVSNSDSFLLAHT